jgi:NTE family protein
MRIDMGQNETRIQFRNLVFEGGGVKGLGYIGAMEALEARGYLKDIRRVGGTSAGAINALLFALDLDIKTQWEEMQQLDFNKFKDRSWLPIAGLFNVFSKFGWYSGDFFTSWIEGLILKKLGKRDATFAELKAATGKELYVVSTNLSTGFAEVFSYERHPNMAVAKAVRMSMSIPLFFTAQWRNPGPNLFVDGGCVLNYPVKLFDREKYIYPGEEYAKSDAVKESYYKDHNLTIQNNKAISPYFYNKQTLGLRLDTKEEIAIYRYNEPGAAREIKGFKDYIAALLTTLMLAQENQHIHSDDWQRTVYIDCLDVKVTSFDIKEAKKTELIESGRTCAKTYFDWFTAAANDPVNRIKPAEETKGTV